MAFDFPASPTSGQVYTPTGGPSYQWDGEKWKGGQPSGPQTEQFFDLSGLAQFDFAVPSWAKGVEFTGYTMSASGTYPVLRVSMDGTTFLTGAADYANVGPIHNSGSSGYATAALATGDHIQLGLNSDSTILPQLFNANMALVRSATSNYYVLKNYLSLFHSAATSQYRSYWNTGEVRNATGLAIRALRVLCQGGGVFGAASWLKVKWIGDAAQVPISNAIADAPSDGKTYGRLNGAWTQALPIMGGTLTGDLTIAKASPALNLNKAASGGQNILYGQTNGVARWAMELGSGVAESGANVGSDFGLSRFSDAGAYLSSPINVSRATGLVTMGHSLQVSGNSLLTNVVSGHSSSIGSIVGVAGMSYDPANGMILESGGGSLHVNKIGANGASVAFYHAGAGCGSITVANTTSTAYNTTSDGRLKEDRQSFDAGPVIDALHVYDFQWKGQEARGHGVIAQDAIEVFPEAIYHDEEADSWGADYSKFVPLLLQEVKALRARVAELEAR